MASRPSFFCEDAVVVRRSMGLASRRRSFDGLLFFIIAKVRGGRTLGRVPPRPESNVEASEVDEDPAMVE